MSGEQYQANSIKVLKGLEAVRKRPAMYIGSTNTRGLHHLVFEVIDNSIDEAMAGHCDKIDVIILKDESISVRDNGRGIPTDYHEGEKKSALEVALTTLHAGGKFDADSYKVSGGLHGVGVSCVNALSIWTKVKVFRDGKTHEQSYKRGFPDGPLKVTGETKETGTLVTFKPDHEIFEETIFNFDTLSARLRELAFLNKGIRITIIDERKEDHRHSFYYPGGIASFVEYLNEDIVVLHKPPIYFRNEGENFDLEISIQYNDSYKDKVFSFVNNINTVDGGTHLAGFRSSLTRTINNYAKKNNMLKGKNPVTITGDDIKEGLTSVISIKISNPQFEGQTKHKLGNPEVKGIVESSLNEKLGIFLEENPPVAKKIIDKCIGAATAREAARKAKQLSRRKNFLETGSLPGKLADCSSKDRTICEIFIVEGDSAGGSAKMGRDRSFQAILPLRGKILNVEKKRLDKILSSEEIKVLISAIGTGIGDDEFDMEKRRYDKIIIMTDADVDGAHIRTLLMTFFFRYMEKLITDGHLYIAQPPLYKIKQGKREVYAFSDEEKNRLVKELDQSKNQKVSIQRYKGLGEMNPEQLATTTMEPDRRILLQVTLEDAVEADKIFTKLMGDEVEPRRKFIEDHAHTVKELDV